ncbi:unnamed protein product [Amoebophrya sp. A120]|nr:unnamed protein product [Amoebophrya sp. A120]|eukprot:GSA120T00013139001.1
MLHPKIDYIMTSLLLSIIGTGAARLSSYSLSSRNAIRKSV